MIHAQRALIDHLGIRSLHAVVGGSMGGMQALQWIVEYPGFARTQLSSRQPLNTVFKPLLSMRREEVRFGEIGLEQW